MGFEPLRCPKFHSGSKENHRFLSPGKYPHAHLLKHPRLHRALKGILASHVQTPTDMTWPGITPHGAMTPSSEPTRLS